MSKFKLSKPSPGGDKWDKDAHVDHLHLFIADEFAAEEIDTALRGSHGGPRRPRRLRRLTASCGPT